MAQARTRQARQIFVRTFMAGAAALTLLSGALHTGAAAEENAKINEIVFDVPPTNFPSTINVTSSDGTKWDTIEPGHVSFSAHMKVDTAWPGYVDQVGVFLGQCENLQCGNGYPLLFHERLDVRDYDKEEAISFPTSRIPVSGPGIAIVPYGDQILSLCNTQLQPDGATKEHTFNKGMTVSFSVNTRKSVLQPPPVEVLDSIPDYNGGEVTRQAAFHAKVVCKARPKAEERPPEPLAARGIDLFLSTYVNVTSQPNPATVCKKARLLVRLEASRAGPVKFKLWTKVGDAPMASKFIDAWASHDGAGKFKAEYDEWVEVTKTTSVQAMAEDKTNAIGQSTGWKDIVLHCTGVGGGGLADAPRPNTDRSSKKPLKPNARVTPPARLTAQTGNTPPTISCIGGVSTGTACFCGPRTVKVQTGPNAFRCVMGDYTTVQPQGPFMGGGAGRPGFFVRPAPQQGPGFMRPPHRESSMPQRPFVR